jgi:hypothetical protein
MRSSLRFVPATLLIWLGAHLPCGAQELYRWVDENGRVQYSDRPPPSDARSQKQIKAAPRAPQGDPAVAPSYVEQEAEFRRRQVEKAEKEAADQKTQQAAAEAKRDCDRARQTLARLESGARYVRYNANGEQEYLDDKARAEEIARTRQAVAGLCK